VDIISHDPCHNFHSDSLQFWNEGYFSVGELFFCIIFQKEGNKMEFYTADICDAYREEVQVLAPGFRHFGGIERFAGPIRTLRLRRNNHELIALLKEQGEQAVAVVEVDGAYEAVVGENLMKFARENGWAGILIHGYVRDTHVTRKIPVGLLALGTCPRKSFEKNPGVRGESLHFGDVTFRPGDWLFADGDGTVVVKASIALHYDKQEGRENVAEG
jgi:regulator of ribonuclease activity A